MVRRDIEFHDAVFTAHRRSAADAVAGTTGPS
jgi:hypothetical protein